jgi:thioredoxin reductase (NADPH)
MSTTDAGEHLAETADPYGAYPRLDPQQIEALTAHGTRRATTVGEVLFRAGDRGNDFVVVLHGMVAIVEHDRGAERLIAAHGPGRFLGELNLLTGERVFVSAIVREPGEILVVPAERLRELVAKDPVCGDLILRAFIIRRSILIGLRAGLRIVGSRHSPDTRRLREFAARNRLPHSWIDLEEYPAAEKLLCALGVAAAETPVVIWCGETLLRNPTNAELARLVGLPVASAREAGCDLVIVGMGPAGLAAAVYAASEGLRTMVVDAVAAGGQAGTASRIENYLGFPSGISGAELAERAALQAAKFGARPRLALHATALSHRDGQYITQLDGGGEISSQAVVIATGARYRTLDIPRLEEFEGTSVFYAATEIEAQSCRNDPIAIVGGGNSAGQAAVFLASHAPEVHLLIRGGDLGANMSRYLVDTIQRLENVHVVRHTVVTEVIGEERLAGLVVVDSETGGRHELAARALFVFIGARPHTDWLSGVLDLDDRGFILTGRDVPRDAPVIAPAQPVHAPLLLETSQPGVFAAGDVRSGSIKRVASAVGEGSMAIRFVWEHLTGVHELERRITSNACTLPQAPSGVDGPQERPTTTTSGTAF